MASGVTDAGKTILLNNSFKGSTVAADYHLILISDTSGVDRDLTTLAGVTELPQVQGTQPVEKQLHTVTLPLLT